jgi:signal peptidase I
VSCQNGSLQKDKIEYNETNLKKFLTKKDILEIVITIVIAAIFFVGYRLSFQTYIVHYTSMEPNYQNNEWTIVNKIAYKFHAPERGDIIVFYPPISPNMPFIKRIIGLPGEIVEIKDGTVYIHKQDGSVITLQEPYVKESFTYSYTSSVIPPNEYFVLGDNRDISEDSHYGWFASRDKIVGKEWINIWPPHLWSTADIYRQPTTTTSLTGK